METLSLHQHPDHPPRAITSVSAAVIGLDAHWLRMRWRVEGTEDLVVPPFAGRARADGLWQTTCFELFLRSPGTAGYCEFNLSPSEQWAAYDFSDYRAGMENRPMPRLPDCTLRRARTMALFDASLPSAGLPALPWQMAITAVLEEAGGVKSYWSLAHPTGKADFHHPACFAAKLAAPETA